MGSSTSGQINIPSLSNFIYLKAEASSIELTQLFLVANNLIHEMQQLVQRVEGNRLIIQRITKVSLTANQTLIDAFGFWTRFVSICNLGEGKNNKVYYQFEKDGNMTWNLGISGDLKLQWFGEVLNDFLQAIEKISVYIPRVLEQLKCVQERMVRMATNISEKNKTFRDNINILKLNISFIKIINIKIIKYREEIEILKSKYEQVAENADEQGERLYKKFGARKLTDGKSYCMKTKVNIVIEQCFHGEFRSEKEADVQNKQKEKRKLKKPPWNFGDDIGIGVKKFPYRIRWTGCDSVDNCFLMISHFLENHSKHLLSLRKLSVFIRYLTRAYKTDDDTLARAWSIFCNFLTAKERNIIQNSVSILEGLKKFKLKDEEAEKCRSYFIKYIELFDKDLLEKLQNEWKNYTDTQDKILALWSNNQIFQTEQFQQLDYVDKYYALTSMAKNVYALQNYFPVATKVYNNVYKTKLQKGQDFLNQLQSVYITSTQYTIPFNQLYSTSKSEDNQDIVKKKDIKFKYAFQKFQQDA